MFNSKYIVLIGALILSAVMVGVVYQLSNSLNSDLATVIENR